LIDGAVADLYDDRMISRIDAIRDSERERAAGARCREGLAVVALHVAIDIQADLGAVQIAVRCLAGHGDGRRGISATVVPAGISGAGVSGAAAGAPAPGTVVVTAAATGHQQCRCHGHRERRTRAPLVHFGHLLTPYIE